MQDAETEAAAIHKMVAEFRLKEGDEPAEQALKWVQKNHLFEHIVDYIRLVLKQREIAKLQKEIITIRKRVAKDEHLLKKIGVTNFPEWFFVKLAREFLASNFGKNQCDDYFLDEQLAKFLVQKKKK